MKKKKFICLLLSVVIVMMAMTIAAFALNGENDYDDSGTVICAYVESSDFSLSRAADANAYAVVNSYTDIKDDNHLLSQAVEVWCVTDTWLSNYYSGTADGIPDWTLMAMCTMSVSNGTPKTVTSPTASAYNRTSVTATTKKVAAKDGGSATAVGYHTVKNYYGEIVWNSETKAQEYF